MPSCPCLRAGDVICRAGDAADRLLVVISGSVRVSSWAFGAEHLVDVVDDGDERSGRGSFRGRARASARGAAPATDEDVVLGVGSVVQEAMLALEPERRVQPTAVIAGPGSADHPDKVELLALHRSDFDALVEGGAVGGDAPRE